MEHLDNSTLWQYVTDASGIADNDRIQNHLLQCEDCKREYDLLMQIEEALHAVDEEVPSLGFSNAVVRKLEAESAYERKNRFWNHFFLYAVLGAFTLAFLSVMTYGFGFELELSKAEEAIKGPLILLLSTSIILWLFYIVDRICNRIFRQTTYSES